MKRLSRILPDVLVKKSLWIALLFATNAHAAVNGRYVRFENTTGPMMMWTEVEVFSGSQNLVLNKPEFFSGSGQEVGKVGVADDNAKRVLCDGNKDTSKRSPEFINGNDCNPWIEIDLGESQPIDKVILYGSIYPQKLYCDKGHRLITILDKDRKVVWVDKFDYNDQKKYPKGIFEFAPSAGQQTPVSGHFVPTNTASWIPMDWFVDVPEEKAPPDAASRMDVFKQRNDAANIKNLADELFNLLEPLPELADARKFYAEGKYAAALDAWKIYWFAKMKKVNQHACYDVDEFNYDAQGDDLLNGLSVTITYNSVNAARFTPGRIDWVDLPEDPVALTKALADTANVAHVNFFGRGLLKSYARNGKAEYVRQWSAIMDDWCMNFFKDADASEYNVKNLFVQTTADRWGVMMEYLSAIADKRPELINEMSAATLARIQITCLDQYGPAYWRVCRNTVFNHTSSALLAWFRILPYIDEFKPGERIAKEWREQLARWMTQGVEPDGSMVEIGDEGHFSIPENLGYVFSKLDKERPDWYTPGVHNRVLEYFDNIFKYNFRHVTQGGFMHRFGSYSARNDRLFDIDEPNKRNRGYQQQRKVNCKETFLDRSQEIYSIPETRRILDAVCDVSSGKPPIDAKLPVQQKQLLVQRQADYEEAVKILGNEKPGAPKINSDWMPYTGQYFFRGSWDRNAPFMGMFAPGSKGGAQADSFEWGYGVLYNYDYNFPLTRVNSILIDNTHYNPLYPNKVFMPGSKTDSLTYAQKDPSPFRWHSSAGFDYGEAIYEGAYQNLAVGWKKNAPAVVDFGKPAIEGVRSDRRVLFLRGQRLFIYVDAIHYKAPDQRSAVHNYSDKLTLMQINSTNKPVLDVTNKTVSTVNSESPNGTIRQYSILPIQYAMGRDGKPDGDYANRIGSNFEVIPQEVIASWKTTGDFAIVSLLSTADKGLKDPIIESKPLNSGQEISGFRATLADGANVWCQSAVDGSKNLSCEMFTADAETVVVVKDKAGNVSGLALGCKKLTVNGHSVKVTHPDFEFAGAKVTQNIYAPISPVEFSPPVNAFIDKATVEMKSKTPGVEIRYTTDGSTPTRISQLYTGPLTITETTEFAARAYRSELPADDCEINGTKLTVPSYGWFYKKPVLPATKAEGQLVPGLTYELIHDQWTKLFTRAHWMKPESTGVVSREMEVPTPQTAYYALLYKGFITVPTTGVYTFHAPREYVYADNATSYDLRLYIDGQEWDLTQWWHGHGTWSIPLAAGLHRFQLDFADARIIPYRKSDLWAWFPTPHCVYQGPPSDILISGPGLEKQRIPQTWLSH